MTERSRLPGCKCPFPSQEADHHATNCIHFRGDTTMSDERHPGTESHRASCKQCFFGKAPSLPTCSCPSPTQIPDGGHPRSCPRYEAPSDGWSSTPPPSGDMHALTPTQGIQYLNWIPLYEGWASMGMRHSRAWLMAQGWQFRPADSAAAPGIHQAAMEERLHTVGYRLDALRHCIGSPGTNLVRGQQLAETLANDAHWLKLLADELLAKEVCADAGQVYDDLAEDCMRAVVAWQGS